MIRNLESIISLFDIGITRDKILGFYVQKYIKKKVKCDGLIGVQQNNLVYLQQAKRHVSNDQEQSCFNSVGTHQLYINVSWSYSSFCLCPTDL